MTTTPSAPKERQAQMPQLDGLRAIAVSLVLVQHYAPANTPWLRRVGPGGLGVSLFFVLSGFLITGILLDVRPPEGAPRGPVLGAFYARRFLRIFPLYYAVLFASALLDVQPVRRTLHWHLLYLSNVYFALQQRWEGPTTPLWSLALEEQFYLLWPLVVLSVSPRRLLTLTAALVALGPLFRLLYCFALGPSDFWLLLPFGNTDLLFAGALLSLCWRDRERLDPLRRALVRAGVYVALPLLVASALFPATQGSAWWFALRMVHVSAVGLASLAVVDAAARGVRGPVGSLLASRPLGYVGRISYGIYLIHAFVHFTALGLGRVPGLRWLRGPLEALAARPWAWFPVACATAVLFASLTYALLERPLNERKRHFPYPTYDRRGSNSATA